MSDLFFKKETDMYHVSMSDEALLALLIGAKRAAQLYQGSLCTLLREAADSQQVAYQRINAAYELVRRAMHEELRYEAILPHPQAVRDYLRVVFVGKTYETFVIASLDAQHRVIALDEVFRGTLTQTAVYPREVVKLALKKNAAAMIFAHNHPSGVAEPSRADEVLTRSLQSALALIDVRVLDHFVIAGGSCLSFAERGLI